MAKQKKIDYPNISIDEAIRCMTVLIEKFDGKAKPESFAPLLGHKSEKSGTFIVKLGDLRRYGLLESRGEVKATPLAEKLVHPKPNSNERQEAINEMIMNVEVWKLLYNRLGKQFPPDDEFWAHIAEALNVDRNEAIKYSAELRNKYKEVIQHYNKIDSTSSDIEMKVDNFDKSKLGGVEKSSWIMLKCGGVNISLPQNNVNIDIVKNILENLKESE